MALNSKSSLDALGPDSLSNHEVSYRGKEGRGKSFTLDFKACTALFQVPLDGEKEESGWQTIFLKLFDNKNIQFGKKIKRRRHNKKLAKQKFRLAKMLGNKQFYRVL